MDGEPFSHGDLHLSNLVYCTEEKRASILDFETPHDRGLTPAERHGDDLQSLVLDLVGQVAAERCAPLARAFFEGYGGGPALVEARRRLVIETGLLRRSLQLVRTRLHAPEDVRDVLADAVR